MRTAKQSINEQEG